VMLFGMREDRFYGCSSFELLVSLFIGRGFSKYNSLSFVSLACKEILNASVKDALCGFIGAVQCR